jgi:uncharacterized protein YciI
MSDYIYLIHPFRDGYFEQPTSEETDAMEAHERYLKEATEAGVVLCSGLCLDDTFGVVVFKAENDELARKFMFADPSIEKNVMMSELHPLRVSFKAK